jgi:uncharacterized protein
VCETAKVFLRQRESPRRADDGGGVLRFEDFTDRAQRLLEDAEGRVERLFETDLRLGVTGLRRSGKTVFVTALVDALLKGGRLPFLRCAGEGRLIGARLRPQPDHDVPRFSYETHLQTLHGAPADWPRPTQGVGQIRVSLRYRPARSARRLVQSSATLNLDVVDYPGEWLLDLPLLGQSYDEWCAFVWDLAKTAPRDELSADWRAWCADHPGHEPAAEDAARSGAAVYTAYLLACRDHADGLNLLQPGRFVEPGDLRGAPLLTFCPLPPPEPGRPAGRGDLRTLMTERYEAYRNLVVRRFFAEHFARLNRQIVLVDVLGALAGEAPGWRDTKRALELSLEAFRHGRGGWLDWLTGPRIDKVLFAATKADHLPGDQHPNLRNLLSNMVGAAAGGIRYSGAAVETLALASVRSTETVDVMHDGRKLRGVRGAPLGRDGQAFAYPGAMPEHPPADGAAAVGARFATAAFRPPDGLADDARGMPHIRLDEALQILIGDYLE